MNRLDIARRAMFNARGWTPETRRARMWQQFFLDGGPRTFRNHGGQMEERWLQDFGLVRAPRHLTALTAAFAGSPTQRGAQQGGLAASLGNLGQRQSQSAVEPSRGLAGSMSHLIGQRSQTGSGGALSGLAGRIGQTGAPSPAQGGGGSFLAGIAGRFGQGGG